MKKNLNIIKINGFRGIAMIVSTGCCLAAGFIVFPGWLAMHLWNLISAYCENMPAIGLIQGILLWGIAVASYFTFGKNRIVICVKSPKSLSEEELKAVFSEIKKQSQDDTILQAMLKAREAELKLLNETKENEKEELNTNEKTEIK